MERNVFFLCHFVVKLYLSQFTKPLISLLPKAVWFSCKIKPSSPYFHFVEDKVWLTSLHNFKYITVSLYVLYVLNMYVIFCVNRMLFTIRSINLFFMHNIKV